MGVDPPDAVVGAVADVEVAVGVERESSHPGQARRNGLAAVAAEPPRPGAGKRGDRPGVVDHLDAG